MTGYRLTITPQGRGRFLVRHNGKVLHHSTTMPLLDCARVLLQQGAKPKDRIWIENEIGVVSLSSTVGAAAKLTVTENDHAGPFLSPYHPFNADRRAIARAAETGPRGAGGGLIRKRL